MKAKSIFYCLLFSLLALMIIAQVASAKVIHVCDTCSARNIEQGVKAIEKPGIDLLYLHDLRAGTPGYHITRRVECPGGIISFKKEWVTSDIEIDNVCPASPLLIVNLLFDGKLISKKDGVHDLRRNCFEGNSSGFSLSNSSSRVNSKNNIWSYILGKAIEFDGNMFTSEDDLVYGMSSGTSEVGISLNFSSGSSSSVFSINRLFLKNFKQGIQTTTPISITGPGRISNVENLLIQFQQDADVTIDNYHFLDNGTTSSSDMFYATGSPNLRVSKLDISDNAGKIFHGNFGELFLTDSLIKHIGESYHITKNVTVDSIARITDSTLIVENRLGSALDLSANGRSSVALRNSYFKGFEGAKLGGKDAITSIDRSSFSATDSDLIFALTSSKITRITNSSFTNDYLNINIFGFNGFPNQGSPSEATQNISWSVRNNTLPKFVYFKWNESSPTLPTHIANLQRAGLLQPGEPLDFGDNAWLGNFGSTGSFSQQVERCLKHDVYRCDISANLAPTMFPKQPQNPPGFPNEQCKPLEDRAEIHEICRILEEADETGVFECEETEESLTGPATDTLGPR